MAYSDLWKYCTAKHCNDLLLSMGLLEPLEMTSDKQLACLYALSNHPEQHYRTIRLPKHDGSFRTIDAPDFLMKTVQSNLLRHFLEQQPISPYAAAYHKHAAPAVHARLHVGSKRLLKLDLKDFFPSITFPMVRQHAFPSFLLPPAVGILLTGLRCLRETLPQGSSASPCISNLVMCPFDDYMGGWCEEQGIRYSRYCDDMTFSGDFDCEMVLYKVRGFLSATGFTLNEKKTCIAAAGQQQTVTGIVVNEKPQVSRAYRKKIRQEIYYCRKFGLKSHLTHSSPDASPTAWLHRLLGKINWVLTVNPKDAEFIGYRSQVRTWMEEEITSQESITAAFDGFDDCDKSYTPRRKTTEPR